MKSSLIPSLLGAVLAAIGLLSAGGCGKGTNAANVVTVNISSSVGSVLILGQSTTLTALVNGVTNTNVTWNKCQFTTTTTTNGKSTTSTPADCPPDPNHQPSDPDFTIFGSLTNKQITGTATFTAPQVLPDQTKYPSLQIVISATSAQDTTKTGKINLSLNSGIGISLTPTTASVPTKELQQFNVQLTNDLQSKSVDWLVTQNVPSTTTTNGVTTTLNFPQLPTCSPSCGTITPDTNNPNVAIYTAPDTVPTAITPAQKNNTNAPANLTIVATSKADNTRFALGIITVITGGPITFNGITPTIAPQGATLWDIYLDAPNISSSSKITLTDSNGGSVTKDSTTGQIKILFPIPTSTTTNPTSTGARLRLLADDLKTAGPFTLTVTDPAEPVCPPTCTGTPPPGPYTYTIIPVRPTTTATVPDSIVQSTQAQNFPLTIDGGYFGPGGRNSNNLVRVYYQSPANPTLTPDPLRSNSRQLFASLPAADINPNKPGLYPLYVASNSTPAPIPNNPSVTNMAIFPDYSTTKPGIAGKQSLVGQNASAIDIDPTLGVLVVAETGSNTIEFFSIASGSLASLGSVGSTGTAPINVPTSISVDRTHHTVAVVNYGSQTTTTTNAVCQITSMTGQSVTVLNIPGNPTPIMPFSVDLSGALQNSVCPAPMPYSIGVDPDSNLALVAYSSNSVSSALNLGFIVNLNPNSGTNNYGCPLTDAITGQSSQSGPVGQCLFAQVTLNTGVYPQIAMSSHNHLALVTPGGSGSVRGVDVTHPSSANVILSATLAAGLVTVNVNTKNDGTSCPGGNPPPGQTSCPFTLVPGNAGSVLIAGVKPGNSANNTLFNGVFSVSVTSSNSFTYVVPNATATDTGSGGTVFYGSPDQIFGLPSTTQGVAINPITSTAAIADVNAIGTNGPQIDLLSALDQSFSSITFFATCTAFTTPCSSSPELLATTNVAWQPFTNGLVSYNPQQGFVSVSDPVSRTRYAIVNGLGPSAVAFPVSNGTNNPTLTLWGGVAVDPATNQAFIAESGQAANPNTTPPTTAQPGQIQIINLGPALKPTHISELIVPGSTPGGIGGIPNALVPQAALTSTAALAGVQIFGTGFAAGAQVRLDSVDITTKGGTITNIAANGREIDVTIPPFFLSAPHHYALDVISNGVQSNVTDFIVIQAVDMSKICTDTNGKPINSLPTSVAIADQLANGPFAPIAVVSNNGCNSISVIDIKPGSATFGQLIGSPIAVGTGPQGVAISERRGLAVVANNGSNNASIIDLTQNPPAPKVPDVGTGTSPTGVAINDATGAAITANTGSNTITMINFGLLFPAVTTPPTVPPTTLTPISIGGIQQPLAVAVDPDRGANSQGIAVVTAVQLNSGSAPNGALAVVEIGLATPVLSSTIPSGFVTGTPTGIVFDPAVATGTTNPGVFFANSSGSNVITEFNPDTGGGSSVSVGINPTSLAINPQTGAILTSNSSSNTVSVVDTLSNPFKTQKTLGIPGSPTFGVAIDQFTNLAVIVDQAHQRVLLFPMPN